MREFGGGRPKAADKEGLRALRTNVGRAAAFGLVASLFAGCFPLGDLTDLTRGSNSAGGAGGDNVGGEGGSIDDRTCSNERLDSGESGVDCGRACDLCGSGVACDSAADCASGRCVSTEGGNVCGAIPVPAFIPAERYEMAFDTTSGNAGGACRKGDVELEASPSSTEHCIAEMTSNEWLEYRIIVPSTGEYEVLPALNATTEGTSVDIALNGSGVGSRFEIPSRSLEHFSAPSFSLGDVGAGEHVLRFSFSGGTAAFAGFEVRTLRTDDLPRVPALQEFEFGDPGASAVSTSLEGYGGMGYLGTDGSATFSASVVVDVASSGFHRVDLRYATPNDGVERTPTMTVSGSKPVALDLSARPAFETIAVGEFWFDAGANEIVFTDVPSGLWLDSVAVDDGARNLARGGVAGPLSAYEGTPPGLAIDGDENTHVTSSLTDAPYLEVDLGASHCVSAVVLVPRSDCCEETLDNADVLLGRGPETWTASRPISVGPRVSERYEFLGVEARYVRLALRGASTLNLGELEVLGVEGECGSRPIGEVGSTTGSQPTRYDWNTTSFRRRYHDPIVVLGPPTRANTDIVVTRLRWPQGNGGFSFRLAEWEYDNGPHPTIETLSFLVMERGVWTLPGAKRAIVDRVASDSSGSRVTFPQPFSEAPVVLGQVASTNQPNVAAHKMRDLDASGFHLRLAEQLQGSDGVYGADTVNYVAIGSVGANSRAEEGAPLECKTTSGFSSGFRTVAFDVALSDGPAIFAGVQNDVDPRARSMRRRNLGETSVELSVEVENSSMLGPLSGEETVGHCATSNGTIFGSSSP